MKRIIGIVLLVLAGTLFVGGVMNVTSNSAIFVEEAVGGFILPLLLLLVGGWLVWGRKGHE